jgi:ribosomal protein S18 acetylase RimI-like enzyme
VIRPYKKEDWKAICQIHNLARLCELQISVGLDAFLSLEHTYQNEGLFDGEVWVYERGVTLVGFMAINGNELTWLYVSPKYHTQGIGRALLKKAIEIKNGVLATEVLVGNEPALKLYLSEGFEIVELTKGKLSGNEKFEAEGIYLKTRISKFGL